MIVILWIDDNLHNVVGVAFEHLGAVPFLVPVPKFDQHVVYNKLKKNRVYNRYQRDIVERRKSLTHASRYRNASGMKIELVTPSPMNCKCDLTKKVRNHHAIGAEEELINTYSRRQIETMRVVHTAACKDVRLGGMYCY